MLRESWRKMLLTTFLHLHATNQIRRNVFFRWPDHWWSWQFTINALPLTGLIAIPLIESCKCNRVNLYYMVENMGSASCLYGVFFSFLLFNVVNKLVFVFFPPPKKLRFQVKKAWLWGNIAVSWVHSSITAVLSSYRWVRWFQCLVGFFLWKQSPFLYLLRLAYAGNPQC